MIKAEGRLLSTGPRESRFTVPDGIRAAVRRTLAPLSDNARLALTVASVIGHEFEFPLLRRTSGLADDQLIEALDQAIELGLVMKYHRDYQPTIRPTFCDFPDDSRCYAECYEMMVGSALGNALIELEHYPALLAAAVVAGRSRKRAVRLPARRGVVRFLVGPTFRRRDLAIARCHVMASSALRQSGERRGGEYCEPHFATRGFVRGFYRFPHAGSGRFAVKSFEDDGHSEAYLKAISANGISM